MQAYHYAQNVSEFILTLIGVVIWKATHDVEVKLVSTKQRTCYS
jgi:hypothetical protein